MLRVIAQLLQNEDGFTAIEYGLIALLTLIALGQLATQS